MEQESSNKNQLIELRLKFHYSIQSNNIGQYFLSQQIYNLNYTLSPTVILQTIQWHIIPRRLR